MDDVEKEAEHRLLAVKLGEINTVTQAKTRRGMLGIRESLLALSLCVSVIYNFALHVRIAGLASSQQVCASRYTGLALEESTPYDRHSVYAVTTDLNKTSRLWEALDTSPNVVALTDEYAVHHGIPISPSRFPWDNSKGLYHLKAYHHLHCLKNIFRSVFEMRTGQTQSIEAGHIFHCIDALRQDIMCLADDTPMPEGMKPGEIGHNQVRQCKNLDKLEAWTQAPERNACFRKLTDYRKIYHTLEAFQFCPPDSPYRQVAADYFAVFGHKDPFTP